MNDMATLTVLFIYDSWMTRKILKKFFSFSEGMKNPSFNQFVRGLCQKEEMDKLLANEWILHYDYA